MKKLHGTYSIQPLTITNSVIAEDAAIDENKINLSFSTASLNQTLDTVSQNLDAHVSNNTDPHGTTLVQSILQTEVIHSDNTDNTRTISVSNPGEGDVSVEIEGDISAVNANFSGDTNIAGITTIGGQTHITGNVVIDGNLNVSGETTVVESNTIDYDSLLVTPSTALNRTGIIVAPDGTGFVDDESSTTTTTTTTVHNDLLYTNNGYIYNSVELPNGDLVISLASRIVKTNAGISEIKAVYEADENEELEYIAIGTDGDLFVITDNTDTNTVYVTRLDTNLNFISKSSAMINPSTNDNVEAEDVYSFDYIDNRFYISLYDSGLVGYFDEYDTDKSTGETTPTQFVSTRASITLDALIPGASGICIYYVKPFRLTGSENTYILVSCTAGVYILDNNFNIIGNNVISTESDMDQLFYQGTFLDTRSNRVIVSLGECVFFSFDISSIIEGNADMMTANLTTTTVSSDFCDSSAGAFIMGVTGNSNILYYNYDNNIFKWVDSSKFLSYETDIDSETGDPLPNVDIHMIVATRIAADGYVIEPEPEEESDPFEIDPEADPLASYGLDNYGAVQITTDSDGNFYFVGDSSLADCITKVDAETLKSTSVRVYNIMTEGEYMFGYNGIFGLGLSADNDKMFVSCSSMVNEVGPTAIYRYSLSTRVCDPESISMDYLQGGFNYGSTGHYKNIWFSTLDIDRENNRLVLIGGTTDQQNDLGGILILDPEDYSTIKYIQVSSVHPYVQNDRGSVMISVSPDGDYAYIVEYYTEDGYYASPRKAALNKIPLDAGTSYDPTTSPDCQRLALYDTEGAATYGYPVSIKTTPEGRLFVATVRGHIFELDPDTLEIVDETDILSAAEIEEKYNVISMAVNSNTMLVGYVNLDNSWDLENYGLRAYDISNDTLVSEATVTESVPYDGPTPAAPNVSEEPEEPGELETAHEDVIRVTTQTVTTTESTGDTFLGNLLELQKRTRGFNEAAVIVDKSGTLKLLTGGIEVGNVKGAVNNNALLFDKGLGASLVKSTNDGFLYKPSSDNQPNNKALDIQDASGSSNAFITKNGDATVNSITVGMSSPITESGTGIVIPNDVNISSSELLLDNSILTFAAENKNEWRVLNRNSTVSFYYSTEATPQVELGDNLFDISNCETTKTDNIVVMGDATFNGSVNMAANMTVDGIKVGSHDHTGGDMGTVLPQTAVTGLKTFVDNINTTIKNCVNDMTSSNTESGIDVAYNSTTGKLNFAVNDFILTLSGDASGSATIQHASDTTLSVTVLDSAKLGGLTLPSTTANTEANKVLRTDANGKTTVKALLISSPTAAGTGTLGKIYASVGNETEVKSYTPANFATQLLALGGSVKNSHTHTAVNGLTPVRGSSTFNGVSGRVVMLSSSRANTNYSVAVTPSAAPNGLLGEIWVIKGTDRFTVYNSGSATSAFDYIMLG